MAPVATRVEDFLGALGDESEHTRRELDVERSPAVDEMCRGFEAVSMYEYEQIPIRYAVSERHVPSEYCASDVEKFCAFLVNYQFVEDFSDSAGLYLSALVNQCSDTKVRVITRHLKEKVSSLGYKNEDHSIEVLGDVDNMLGHHMIGGEIVVHGNAGRMVGSQMSGGVIRIEGEFETLSRYFKRGTIFLAGELWVDRG